MRCFPDRRNVVPTMRGIRAYETISQDGAMTFAPSSNGKRAACTGKLSAIRKRPACKLFRTVKVVDEDIRTFGRGFQHQEQQKLYDHKESGQHLSGKDLLSGRRHLSTTCTSGQPDFQVSSMIARVAFPPIRISPSKSEVNQLFPSSIRMPA